MRRQKWSELRATRACHSEAAGKHDAGVPYKALGCKCQRLITCRLSNQRDPPGVSEA